MMCSLPVQIVWHMAISHLEDKILQKTGRHPLRHGTVYVGGGWARFYEESISLGRTWNSDKSGWDWNSPLWPYECCLQLRIRLTIGATEAWKNQMRWLYNDAFVRKRVILPTGLVLEQKRGGLMPSGMVPTITDNGLSQLFLDSVARQMTGEPDSMLVATGDDASQRVPEDPEAYLCAIQQIGCKIKEVSEGVEFMGFKLTEEGYFPLYLGKHLKNLSNQKDEFIPATIDSYLRIYVYDSDCFNFWKQVGQRLGLSDDCIRSYEYYRYFAENPEIFETWTQKRPVFTDSVMADGVLTDN